MFDKNLIFILILSLISGLSMAVPSDIVQTQDLDEEIQGNPTTVTRYNLCVNEKLKAYNPIMGTIPLAAGSLAASDLICDSDECGHNISKGDILTPTQAKRYFEKRFSQTRCQWSLADLKPTQDKNIWTDTLGKKPDIKNDDLKVQDMDKVYFVSQAWGRLGSYRVTVNKYNLFGTPIQYSVFLSKTNHNYILRRALLRKLGYKIPPVKWLKRVKVKFDTKKELDEFISKLSINNAGSFDRWVLSKTNNNEVILQDIVLMEDQEFDLNLSKGYVSGDIAEGRRIYDSLLVPYALVEVPESLNMFKWTFGREYSNNIVVDYPISKEFQTSFHDALWIARRIVKLSDKDWWDIVEATELPASPKLLLYNKLKSRRNHMAKLFGIDNIELKFDDKVSNQDDLVNGEIVKEFYDGYARRFKMPDPESPVNSAQMRSFFKSKSLTIGLNLLGEALNTREFMGTDISGKINKEIENIMSKNVANSIVSGSVTKTPVKRYVFPTVQGNLILNREIIAGGYLGTDNRLQLVDSIGGVLSAGLFGGVTGIYSKTGKLIKSGDKLIRQKIPVSLTGQAKVNISRVYSHVRPIMSIEQGLKYKFKNLFVPNILKKNGNIFNQLLTDEFQVNYDDNPEKGVAKMMELLNEHIEIGESIIITDSIGGDVTGNAKANLYEIVDVKLSVKPLKRLVVSRLHILRKSEEEFHIYKSLGNVSSVEFTAGLEKYIPITKINFKLNEGTARTKYYRVKIGKKNIEGEDNYNRDEKIKAIGSVFSTGSLASMDTVQRPYVLQHNFDEDSTKFGIFVWRWNYLDQNDEIKVFAPDGRQIDLFRRLEGSSSGRDYESYAKDVIKGVTNELLDFNLGFRSFNAGNPGFTYYGKAKNMIATYEGLKTKDGRMVMPFMKLSRIYNGWKLSKESALDKISEIKERYKHQFFDPEVLAQTEELFLYNININFFVHSRGLDHIMSQSNEKITKTWDNFSHRKNNLKGLENLLRKLKWYKIYNREKRFDKVAEMGVAAFRLIENNLSAAGITSIFGGGKNLIGIGKIDGFRIGDENGDESIISNSVGREGAEGMDGPVGAIKRELGMTNGEFYVNWLLGRVL